MQRINISISISILLVIAAVNAQQPQFPNDWSGMTYAVLVQNQNTVTVGDDICCKVGTNCQVQTQFDAGMNYVDFSHNRTRFEDTTGQTIVSFYDPSIQRECNVVNNTCTEYCPLEGDSLTPGFLAANATNIGNTIVNGKTYQQWQWKDYLLGVIIMDVVTVLVDPSTTPPTPFQMQELLTPFGQYLGEEATTFEKIVFGTPNAGYFNITGVTTAPLSSNCGEDSRQQYRLSHGLYKTWMHWQQKNMLKKLDIQY